MPGSVPGRALACLALLMFVAAGCQQTVLPQKELRSGLTETAVVELVGRKPEHSERFALRGRPDERYTVLEYYLAQTKTSPELRYWFLFDRTGLIGYGRGSGRVARGLAYDLYYHWLADHKLMPRAEAERAYLKQLQTLYGADLNPFVVEYAGVRARTMALVDAKKLPLAKAEAAIRKDFSGRLGTAQRTAVYGRIEGEIDRYTTMARIGLDVSRAATISSGGPTGLRPLVSCDRLRAEGATGLRCY
jgi:hypothetical protein